MRLSCIFFASLVASFAFCQLPQQAPQPRKQHTNEQPAKRPEAQGHLLFVIQTTQGNKIEANSVMFTAEGIVVTTSNGEQRLNYRDLLAIESSNMAALSAEQAVHAPTDKVPYVKVVLKDRTEISAKSVTTQGNKASITFVDGKTVLIGRELISYLQFKPLPEKTDISWDEMRLSRLSGDRLIKPNKKGVLDHIDGIAIDLSASGLKFKVDEDTYTVPYEKIHTIQFHQTKDSFPSPIARVQDKTGNRIPATSLSTHDGLLVLKTPGGLEISRTMAQIRSVDFSINNSKRLTELEAEKTEFHPFFDLGKPIDDFYQPRVGRSFFGPIRLGGKEYKDGLSLRSHSKITYRLAEKFTFLAATVGIDDDVRENGDIQFVVSIDDKIVFDERITGKNSPLPINIPIKGAKRLTIEVNFGENFDIGDIFDLADPLLIK